MSGSSLSHLNTGQVNSIGIGLLAAWLVGMLVPFAESAGWKHMGEQALAWFNRLSLSDKPAQDLLIIRTTGDEASAILGTTHFLSWLTSVLVELIPRYAPRNRFLLPGLLVVSVAGLGRGIYLGTKSLTGPVDSWFFAVGTAAFVLLALLLAAPLLSIGMCSMATFGYGMELWFCGPLLEMTAETTPNGSWMVHCFAPRRPGVDDNAFDWTQLRHSEPYKDDRVIETICKRVELACGRQPGSSVAS
jgi:hypothetical protein